LAKEASLETLAYLRCEGCKLRQELYVLSDAAGIVANDLLRGLGLWDLVLALYLPLVCDDVAPLVDKRLLVPALRAPLA